MLSFYPDQARDSSETFLLGKLELSEESHKCCHYFISERDFERDAETEFAKQEDLRRVRAKPGRNESAAQTSHEQCLIKRLLVKRFLLKKTDYILCNELKKAIH